MRQNKSISIIVPVYNEEETLHYLAERLSQLFDTLQNNYVLNAILVDDGSYDRSWWVIEKICSQDHRFSGIRLSRNFGHQAALSCGYQFAPGDAVICIDADLQDPPEVIPEMIRRWEEGNRVVLAVRRKREGETKFKLLTAKLYYRLISKLSDSKASEESGDFRLLDRAAVDAFNKLSERHRYIRGLVGWLGFKTAIVEYDRSPRQGGKTKYTLIKMIRLAMDGIISFSFLPLRLAYIAACVLVLPFLLYLAYNFVLYYFFGVTMVPGWSSLILAVILFGVFNLLMLGFLGEYVGRIYTEVKGRPIFLVEESCGRDLSTFVGKKEDNG
jgi:glycosyltransferase involved in cell wall biosynthesis